jgi:two-component system sensor histidine kinase EvgS
MAYNSLYEWQEIEALELGNKKIDELRKEINNINTLVSTKNCGRLYKV